MATRRPTEPPRSAEDKPGAAPSQPRLRAKNTTPRVRKKVANAPAQVTVSDDVRRGMIAEAAYLRAERRGFEPGREEEDWLAAEAEVDALLEARHGGTSQ